MPRVPEAVARIYAAKGRPANHPVIVHLAPQGDPNYWVEHLPAEAQRLIDAFWPGPLTLILKRAARIAGGGERRARFGRFALPVASGRAGFAGSVQRVARAVMAAWLRRRRIVLGM